MMQEDKFPVPDPTVLTTQQLLQTTIYLREILEGEILGLKSTLEARLTGMDTAIRLIQNNADKSPTIGELNTECKERFRSIDIQFKERDTRVDAALQSAKEAVAEQNKASTASITKSEAATSKQIDALNGKIDAEAKGSDLQVSDLKDRMNRLEGQGAGKNALWGYIVAGAVLIVAVITIFAFIKK